MTTRVTHPRARWFSLAVAGLWSIAGLAGACGGSGNGAAVDGGDGASTAPVHSTTKDAGHTLKPEAGPILKSKTVKSLSISPTTATLTTTNGAPAAQAFSATVHYTDGTDAPVPTGVSWTATEPAVGAIGPSGTYKANGSLGGVVSVTAAYGGVSASATLTVVAVLTENPASASGAVETALKGATAADTTVTWAYPYDATVWPRGLLPPILQWNGGAATDVYYVSLKSATFELQLFTASTGAPASQIALDATMWSELTTSTSGALAMTVARWNGTAATVIAKQGWTIANGSMRGTIYYWSNNLGRVLRISPGASAPVDFANQPPLTDPTMFIPNGVSGAGGCLMTCHTVSADGSTLVSGGGVFAGSYNLKTDEPILSLGGTWDDNPNDAGVPAWTNIQWEVPALSPTGQYILTDSMAQSGVSDLGGPDTVMGLFTTADGMPVANSGVAGKAFAAPSWSPDGTRVAFVDSGDPSGWTAAGYNWQNPPPGDLNVIQFDPTQNPMFSGAETMVAAGTGNSITWPSISPDGQWIIYSRAASFDTRGGNGDLYMASAVTPNQEVRLKVLDGDSYPFAAGSRDLSWNFEPSFAPVAAGGYFWVVFTSRRTYGNILTGQALPCTTSPCSEVKQLWVAAIDQSPTPGKDPSHPPFHLTGQDEANLAMRGFWSLPPCKNDGAGCATGTDCCGGYCALAADAGAPTSSTPDAGDAATDGGGDSASTPAPAPVGICQSAVAGACAANGDRCTSSGDCCGAGSGVVCINKVCSEAPPP